MIMNDNNDIILVYILLGSEKYLFSMCLGKSFQIRDRIRVCVKDTPYE